MDQGEEQMMTSTVFHFVPFFFTLFRFDSNKLHSVRLLLILHIIGLGLDKGHGDALAADIQVDSVNGTGADAPRGELLVCALDDVVGVDGDDLGNRDGGVAGDELVGGHLNASDVHGGDLGTAARRLLGLVGAGLDLLLSDDGALGGGGGGASGGLAGAGGGRAVFDDHTNTGAFLASAELDLGTLGKGGLGVLQGAVETGQVSLLAGSVGLAKLYARSDLLAHTLESGNGLCLYGRNVTRVGAKVDVQGQGIEVSGQAGNGEDVAVNHIVDRFG
ncbi:uncharacterized protein ColSpa_09429 [Colletotrichum spaethianum]|uniref:Uncharacterized protein n=1 Tax=Colletotrichum spaethianum TaxID=700344 RepID=A0AA37UQQ7_9PEZI|nr:uncharacterized protein ColSpa_09429 [Colletotrichum spaethianum]GKT49247.1 hypothetical protein ColSpa_09429 [Colletotrichum spaethianum]